MMITYLQSFPMFLFLPLMPNWKDLPPEVLSRIFNILGYPKDLNNCQLTCKGWYYPAQFQLYRNVSFKNRDRDAVTRFIQCVNESKLSNPGQLVKHMHLGDLFDEMNYRRYDDYLSHLADICPNVESLDAEQPVSSFWEDLAYVTITRWRNLKKVPSPSESGTIVEFALSMLQIRHSLSDITVSPVFYESLEGLKFITHLKHFTNLKSLSLIEPTTPGHIDDLIQDCQKIQKLRISIIDADEDSYDVDAKYSMNSQMIRPYIKILSIDISFDVNSLNYIMDKFTSLDSLTVNIYHDSDAQFSDTALTKKFLNYVLKVPSFTVRSIGSLDLFYSLTSLPFSIAHLDIICKDDSSKPSRPCVDLRSVKLNRVYVTIQYKQMIKRSELANLFKKSGKYIYKLYFSAYDYSNDDSEESLDYFIRDIITYGQALKHLHVATPVLRKPLTIENQITMNRSITGMSIKTTSIEQGALQELSIWLPRLDRLKLYSRLVIGKDQRNAVNIDMPQTSFRYLYLQLLVLLDSALENEATYYADPRHGIFSSPVIFLTLHTDELGEKEYLVKSTKGQVSIESCNRFVEGPTMVSVYVHCRRLETLCIKANSLFINLDLTKQDSILLQ